VETYPDNGARSYVYDAARRLIKRVDQASAATAYVYDMAGRIITRGYPDSLNDTFIYDDASRLTSATSARYSNSVTRAYNANSQITQEQLTVGATPYSIGYAYDADNRQTHVTYPDGSIAVRNFTDRNQLSVVTFNNALVANVAYDNGGRKVGTAFGNGITEARTYQTDNLNTAINTPGVTSFGYTWDANKRKLSQTETGIPLNNQTYAYDDEDRLTGFNRTNGDTQTWGLSLVGDWNNTIINGTQQNRTHNAVHEITTIDANPLVHDVKGNLATNKNGQTYAWDFENRLATATVPTGCPEGIAGTHAYAYDALGRRVSKTVGGNTTVFVSDGLQKICEYENGTLARSYAYGSYIDEPLVMISGANKYYYHSNNLYSVAALTDAAGAVIERYKYDPYGKATILAADGTTTRTASIVNNPFMYDGYYHDTETSLEFVNARYYSSALGRFIARDPIGYVGGMNLYEYADGSPVKFTDPSGLYIFLVFVLGAGRVDVWDVSIVRDPVSGKDVWDTKFLFTIDHVFSGNNAGTNNPICQDVPNTGPLPVGLYAVEDQDDKKKAPGHGDIHPNGEWNWFPLYRIEGTKVIKDFKVANYKTGKLTNTIRGSFYLHTGRASNGCVTVWSVEPPKKDDKDNPKYPQSPDFDKIKNLLNNVNNKDKIKGCDGKLVRGILHVY
jgi:RHS repeat-associated protein